MARNSDEISLHRDTSSQGCVHTLPGEGSHHACAYGAFEDPPNCRKHGSTEERLGMLVLQFYYRGIDI